MKPVYKCDYCKFMGTEEEVCKHESECYDNYDRKSCSTCTHKTTDVIDRAWCFKCNLGIEIPVGQQFVYCQKYERSEKPIILDGIFGSMFGGI